MLPALIPYQRTSTKRIVIYASGMSSIFLAALLFGFHGRLQTPRSELTERGRPASSQVRSRLIANYGKLPLSFELNQGQADAGVKFLSRGRGYSLFLTSSEAVLEVQESGASFGRSPVMRNLRRTTDKGPRATFRSETRKRRIEDAVIRLRLVGAKPDAEVTGREELPGKVNYFIGNDPKRWRTNVPTYARVRYHNVYPGVDLEYYGNQGGQLEYDFMVGPGADPGAITLDVAVDPEPARGQPQGSPLRIDRDGGLVITAEGGDVRFNKPVVYQEQSMVGSRQLTVQDEARNSTLDARHSSLATRHFLEGRFLLDVHNRVHFALGPYDRTRPLVIDPVLSYSTYLGGSINDSGNGIAVDSSGYAYVTGETGSTDFPTVNPLQASLAGGSDAFVTKLNPAGSALVYSTYLGGSDDDQGNGIAVDSSGYAYVTGETGSTDFPTVNPLQASLAGGSDAFVTKLNPAGSALVYSTYLGGSDDDQGNGIAVDSSGSAYVTGETGSTDFPTVNPLQASNKVSTAGYSTAFVANLNAAGSGLIYSTYLGGSDFDQGNGIAVDSSGNAYVTGHTQSDDFPTVNPMQASQNGIQNGFVTKLNATGSALIYSTYLGGSNADGAYGIAVDSSLNAYVAGFTNSTDFPTVNPLQASLNGGEYFLCGIHASYVCPDAFVAKLNSTGSALVYSTYLGGSYDDEAYGIAVDSSGNAYVTGFTQSTDFPTANPLQASLAGPQNAFVARLNPAGSALVYSTYLGGSNVEKGNGIAVDASGNAYITGLTFSTDFPTVNPLQATKKSTMAGSTTGFVAELSPGPAPAVSFSPPTLNFGSSSTTSPPQSVTVTNLGNATLGITNITASGDFALVTTATSCPYGGGTLAAEATCTLDATFTPTEAGVRTGTLTVTDNAAGSPQTVQLSGTGIFPASLSPTSLAFGNQPLGTTSSPQTITLNSPNNGGPGVPEFAITGDFQQQNACDSLTILTLDGPCSITVWFTPRTGGTRTGSLTVTYAQPTASTLTATLTGTGVGPWVSLSAMSVTFPAQIVSTKSAPQTITLTNTGNAALNPLSITRSGDFAETNTCGGSLAGGASCTISVAFSPLNAGGLSGTITLTDNASNSPQVVSLSGTGMDFAVSSTSPSQTVSPGQVGNYSLTLAPQNGFSQTVNLACTGAPSESTCTLTPNTVTLNGTASATVAVAVSTTAPSLAPPQGRFLPPDVTGLRGVFWLYALLWLASVLALALARRRRAAWLLGAGLLIVMLWCACGGGSKTVPPPIEPGTPAGTYTVDVTATDASTSTLTHTIQLTLTVN